MRVVAGKREVRKGEFENRAHGGVQRHPGKWSRLAPQLLIGLLDVVEVEMHVAERVDELARLKVRDLRHHHGEERIGGDVERNAQEHIRRALIKLAGKPSLRDIELEQA